MIKGDFAPLIDQARDRTAVSSKDRPGPVSTVNFYGNRIRLSLSILIVRMIRPHGDGLAGPGDCDRVFRLKNWMDLVGLGRTRTVPKSDHSAKRHTDFQRCSLARKKEPLVTGLEVWVDRFC